MTKSRKPMHFSAEKWCSMRWFLLVQTNKNHTQRTRKWTHTRGNTQGKRQSTLGDEGLILKAGDPPESLVSVAYSPCFSRLPCCLLVEKKVSTYVALGNRWNNLVGPTYHRGKTELNLALSAFFNNFFECDLITFLRTGETYQSYVLIILQW